MAKSKSEIIALIELIKKAVDELAPFQTRGDPIGAIISKQLVAKKNDINGLLGILKQDIEELNF